ncbi:hypothetical protein NDN08_003758 [Rhodosorus marinus]|uniref:Uncharacterized protein n=1 Tax=Rhodosorus marinus TaxID=101924 RepID=A0AAV8UGE3_9RHOD|nr:hypothetical protein NDN08_003758 [Rhodosorus marinus]
MNDEVFDKLSRLGCPPARKQGGALMWTAYSASQAFCSVSACYEHDLEWTIATKEEDKTPAATDAKRILRVLRLLDLGHTLRQEHLRSIETDSSARKKVTIAISSFLEKVIARRGVEGLRLKKRSSRVHPKSAVNLRSSRQQKDMDPGTGVVEDRGQTIRKHPKLEANVRPGRQITPSTNKAREQKPIQIEGLAPTQELEITMTTQGRDDDATGRTELSGNLGTRAEVETEPSVVARSSSGDLADNEPNRSATTSTPDASSTATQTNVPRELQGADHVNLVMESSNVPELPHLSREDDSETLHTDVPILQNPSPLRHTRTPEKPEPGPEPERVQRSELSSFKEPNDPDKENTETDLEKPDSRLALDWRITAPDSSESVKEVYKDILNPGNIIAQNDSRKLIANTRVEHSLRTRIQILRQASRPKETHLQQYKNQHVDGKSSRSSDTNVERDLFQQRYADAQQRIADAASAVSSGCDNLYGRD